jgi:hypothetical protein
MRGASGNPLYVVELTRSLVQQGAFQDVGGVAEVAEDGLPTTFRALVVRRLRSLSQPATDTVRAGAILGLSFGSAELAATLGSSAFELASALEEAVRAGILKDAGDRLAFEHALVRQVVYEEIPTSLRKQLHRETAAALLANGVGPERVATHVSLGADRGDRAAVRWLRQAAARATRRAPGTAAELLERAREIVSPTDPDRDELLADLAMAWATTGRLREAEVLANQVLQRRPGPMVAGRLRGRDVPARPWASPAPPSLTCRPTTGSWWRLRDWWRRSSPATWRLPAPGSMRCSRPPRAPGTCWRAVMCCARRPESGC